MDGTELDRETREAAKADLLRFTALNALSFEILAGQILILFARQVGASLGEIGLLAALLPFASVIQLGATPSWIRACVLMPLAWRVSRMMLPRTAPSVSIFEETTTSARAARAVRPSATATVSGLRTAFMGLPSGSGATALLCCF